MFPQVASGGGTPNPKKLKPASVRIAVAMPIVAETSTGAIALGIMWRNMIRQLFTPRARAAVTKSCSRKERNSARTKRVAPIQLVSPITIIMLYILAGRSATTVRIRKKLGKQSMMSTNRMIRVSMEMVSLRRILNHFGRCHLFRTFIQHTVKNRPQRIPPSDATHKGLTQRRSRINPECRMTRKRIWFPRIWFWP